MVTNIIQQLDSLSFGIEGAVRKLTVFNEILQAKLI